MTVPVKQSTHIQALWALDSIDAHWRSFWRRNSFMHNKTLHLALAITLGSSVSPAIFAADANGVSNDPTSASTAHFDSKGKAPSPYTIELQNGVRKTLPFADKRDFDEAKKGFIAAPSYNKIMAEAGETRPELSGHWHPKLTVVQRGRRIARPCAVASETRMVLPAFGALTGGMNAADPAILAAMQPARAIDALVAARGQVARFPLWRATA